MTDRPEPQIASLSEHSRNLRTRFLEAPVTPAPEPWRGAEMHCVAIGGLQGVGFAQDPDRGGDLLLVTSAAGHGLFDATTGQRLARDSDPDLPYPDEDLTCPGLGPIAGVPVRVAGLYGGGLHTATHDGWSVDVVSPDWPHHRVLLSQDSNPWTGAAWWHIFHARHSELRAAGFSPTGDTLLVATSSDITLWTRAT